MTYRTQNSDIPRAGRPSSRHGGAAGWDGGRAMRLSHRTNSYLRPPGLRRQPSSRSFRKHGTLGKPNRGARRPVDDRCITGNTATLRSGLVNNGPMFFFGRCKPFSCKACPKNICSNNDEMPPAPVHLVWPSHGPRIGTPDDLKKHIFKMDSHS